MTYDEVVNIWNTHEKTEDVFSGHFLAVLVTEVSSLEDINISYNQTKELFADERVNNYTGDLRDLFSVQNNKYLAEFYNRELAKGTMITPEFIRESHRILMKGSIDRHRYHDNKERAGEYKKKDYSVGRYDAGVLPEDVPQSIEELCQLLNEKKDSETIKLATVFHCLFENIHPFADGNGRTGRWLLNYLLVLRGHPPIIIRKNKREEYYKCLEQFDLMESMNPMLEYLKRCTVDSYSSYAYMIGDDIQANVDKIWESLPSAIKDNYTGDKAELLKQFKLL